MKVKTFSYLAAGVILAAVAAASSAQTSVSISVGAPGFYGAIDIGDAPPPALVYQQPVAIQPVAVGVAPLYLYVPPDQYASWGSYCGYYNACNRPVYFVQRGWYQNTYVPHYRSHRSYYDRRRVDFDRRNDIRRPRQADIRRGGPQRHDNHPGPGRAEPRKGPSPQGHPPQARPPQDNRQQQGAPAGKPQSSPQKRDDDHRGKK